MSEDLEIIKKKVTNGVYGLEKKDITKKVLKDKKPRDLEREKICKNARKKAHNAVANAKREISKEVRKSLSLSESLSLEYGKDITFDFLEESYGFGSPELEVTMLDEPVSTELSESLSTKSNNFKIIGTAQGCFAPIGVMSRNGRLYEEDHWPLILENLNVANKVETRRMLGTIGHHDKKVDDEDMASGNVSHVVSELSIKESEDGSKYVFGKLEILDTPAGNLLKSYYDAGIPLFVSSRGGGKLIQRANESFKRVDKNNFYLETWDVVREPGFLEAKPQYISEEVTEDKITEAYNDEENNMKKENETPKTVVSTDMDAEEIVNKLLHPLGEQLNELAEKVSALSEKVSASEKVSEDTPVEEVSEDATEVSEEATEEVSEEAKEEKAEETTEAVSEEKEETVEEVTEECHHEHEEHEHEEHHEEEKHEHHEEKHPEGCNCEKCHEAKEEAKAEEKPAEEEKADKEEAVDESVEETVEETVEEVTEAKAEEKPAEEEKAEDEKEDEKVEEVAEVTEECHKDEKAEEKPAEEEKEEKVSEAIDYEAEYKRSLAVAEKLETAVTKAMEVVKAISEEREALKADIATKENAISEALKELSKYKLCEEFSISLEEASQKLAEKDYEAVREELSKEPEAEVAQASEVSEAVADAKEELVEAITEAKVERKIAKIHSVFAQSINEGKKSSKIHSVFND